MAHRGNLELLRNLKDDIDRDFWRDILQGLKDSNESGWLHMEQFFSHSVAKDLFPHYRRGLFEDKMTSIARKHGFSVGSILNKTKNASHVEIVINLASKRIILTALAVQYLPFEFMRLRKAQFRKTLAEQTCLFEEFANHGDAYYGVILHGSHSEDRANVDYAYVAFPYADCRGWFGRYDLFDLATKSEDTEIIEDRATPTLRTGTTREVGNNAATGDTGV